MHCYDGLFSFLRLTTGPTRIETGLGRDWVEGHSISIRRFNNAEGTHWCLSPSLFLSVGSEGGGLACSTLSGIPSASLSVQSFFIPFFFRRCPQLRHGLPWLLRTCTVSLS